MDDRHTTTDDTNRNVPDENPRVAPLSDVRDFQVADGYPDPRGWDVMAADGRKVGTVHDLIVDTGQLRTRYLDVSLDKEAIGARDDRDVLIPVGAAQLDDSADHVLLGSFSTAQLTTLPEFRHEAITRDYENSVLDHMPGRAAGAVGAAATTTAYYETEHFNDNRFFGTRGASASTPSSGIARRPQDTDVTMRTGTGTGREVGEGVGGASGAVAGGVIGSVAGPVGTAIGAIAGAIGGWWAGREVGEAASGYNASYDALNRTRFESLSPDKRGRFQSYDQARPAYQYGYLASRNPDYRGKSFDQIEDDLRRGWNNDVAKQSGYTWNDVRDTVRDAYMRGAAEAGDRSVRIPITSEGSTTATDTRATDTTRAADNEVRGR